MIYREANKEYFLKNSRKKNPWINLKHIARWGILFTSRTIESYYYYGIAISFKAMNYSLEKMLDIFQQKEENVRNFFKSICQ